MDTPTCSQCSCTPDVVCTNADCRHCRAWCSGRDVGWLPEHDGGPDDWACADGGGDGHCEDVCTAVTP